jgi:hypothetical protein
LNSSWLGQFQSVIDEWVPIFPLVAAAIATVGGIAQQLITLGHWFQTAIISLAVLLLLGYVVMVTSAMIDWTKKLRSQGIGRSTNAALVIARKIHINRTFMLALFPLFILADIYTFTISFNNALLLIGGFFMFSFVTYFMVYLLFYLVYRKRPLLIATLYFTAAAADDDLRSTMRLADSATGCLGRAVMNNTGLLRIRQEGPILTYLLDSTHDRAATLLRLARSCKTNDASRALRTLASVTHTSVESLLERTTLRGRIMAEPWDLILGALAILVELYFRLIR